MKEKKKIIANKLYMYPSQEIKGKAVKLKDSKKKKIRRSNLKLTKWKKKSQNQRMGSVPDGVVMSSEENHPSLH